MQLRLLFLIPEYAVIVGESPAQVNFRLSIDRALILTTIYTALMAGHRSTKNNNDDDDDDDAQPTQQYAIFQRAD